MGAARRQRFSPARTCPTAATLSRGPASPSLRCNSAVGPDVTVTNFQVSRGGAALLAGPQHKDACPPPPPPVPPACRHLALPPAASGAADSPRAAAFSSACSSACLLRRWRRLMCQTRCWSAPRCATCCGRGPAPLWCVRVPHWAGHLRRAALPVPAQQAHPRGPRKRQEQAAPAAAPASTHPPTHPPPAGAGAQQLWWRLCVGRGPRGPQQHQVCLCGERGGQVHLQRRRADERLAGGVHGAAVRAAAALVAARGRPRDHLVQPRRRQRS